MEEQRHVGVYPLCLILEENGTETMSQRSPDQGARQVMERESTAWHPLSTQIDRKRQIPTHPLR